MATKDDDEVGRYRAQTLTRGLTVLRTMADVREPVTLQDLHDRTGIPKPTLVRLLAILTQEGCTIRLDERPTYGLGPTVTAIAAGVADDLHPDELARPYLQRLSAAVGHTANLGVLTGNQVLHLCVVLADRPIRYIVHTGSRDDPHSTGLGKALLAQLDTASVHRIVGDGPMDAKTPRTITTRSKLDAELKRVRKQGYAYDDQEGALGLSCFAVPVVVGQRSVAAVSISGPAGELSADRHADIVPELTKIATQIAADPRLAKALVTIHPGDGLDES
ncbi:IclR family transcriptional regulator [Nakamurella lactea]|uniref:IclR family transcriptional regulator n=1 Tax=Nakamurella lactea TaxID=459515 RepID=UPI000688D6EF|nr:IclR family transcriptional regulator [Nakamurella lactea]